MVQKELSSLEAIAGANKATPVAPAGPITKSEPTRDVTFKRGVMAADELLKASATTQPIVEPT
ncbi:hypothetical protein LDG_6384 [Legionella drancourtii LLAP12]|uniref:Uncharacterized protein n=1 Tax=Legionella drancourtii LLAP12 TaxID=658187 RepID=G9EMB9_9GAMM|nr:hypothetical protein LDG_6384 [Legionella drancourtii LLAP12]